MWVGVSKSVRRFQGEPRPCRGLRGLAPSRALRKRILYRGCPSCAPDSWSHPFLPQTALDSLAQRIGTEDLQEAGHFFKVINRLQAFFTGHVAFKIQVEDVLPGTTAQRARFNLEEVDIPHCKYAQAFKQRSGDVIQGIDDGGLRRIDRISRFGGHDQKRV